MNTDQTSSMHEEALLSEHIDVLSRGTSSTNDPLLRLAAQQSFNKNMASPADIHFWIHFSCHVIGPDQIKIKQGWPRETGTNQMATRKFLCSGHIEIHKT